MALNLSKSNGSWVIDQNINLTALIHKANFKLGVQYPLKSLRIGLNYRVSKNVLYRVSEKYRKYQINNEPNYNTCNRMFDMCSSVCENSIYISLSIAMCCGIFENWQITKMPFQCKRSIS